MPHAIQIRQAGGSEVLNWTAVNVGEPGSGQVCLRQAAAGLNYIDVYNRTGRTLRTDQVDRGVSRVEMYYNR